MPAAASAPPSIYQNMSSMAMGSKPPAAGADGGAGKGDAGAAGGMEEKKQILTTLLEVFKKWDKLETDEAGKKIIAEMMAKAEQYKKEVLKDTAGPAATPPPGGGDTPPPPAGAGGPGGKKEPDIPA